MARPLGKRSKSAKTESSELRAMVSSIDSHEADRRHGPERSGANMPRPYAQRARGMPRCYRCSHRTMVGKCARKNHADSGKIIGAGGFCQVVLFPCAICDFQLRERNAGTYFTDVDGCDLPAKAEGGGAEEVSLRADAGAAVQVQPGLRGLRKDSISGAHFEAGTFARRMFQGRR